MVVGTIELCDQPAAGLGRGLLQEPNDRQRRFLLQEIGAQGLADLGFVAQHVQQVVGDLKSDAQVQAVLGEGLLDLQIRAGEMGPQAAATRRQGSRLAAHDVVILLLRQAVVAAAFDLAKFAFAHDPAGIVQFATGEHVFQGTGQAEGPGEKIVAQEHAGFVVPAGVDRVEMAAHGRLVQHVVMDERGRVDHLHGRRQEDVVRRQNCRRPAR